jgi:hypothetical protein
MQEPVELPARQVCLLRYREVEFFLRFIAAKLLTSKLSDFADPLVEDHLVSGIRVPHGHPGVSGVLVPLYP